MNWFRNKKAGAHRVPCTRRRRRYLRLAVRMAALPFIILVCAGAWLEWKGLPPRAVARLQAYLAENELFAHMDAVRYQFPASVSFEGLRLYESPADPHPLLEADRIRLGWSPLTAWRRRQNIATLRVRGATVTLRGRTNGSDDASPSLALEQLNIYAWFARDGFHLGPVEGVVSGVRILGDAFIEPVPRDPSAPPFALRDAARTLRVLLAQAAEWVPPVQSARRQIAFSTPPRVDFHVHWVPAQWQRSYGEVKATGFSATFRGVSFDRWNARLSLTNGVAEIPAMSVIQGPNRCIAQGRLTLTDNIAQFHVYSTLAPTTWLCFAPLTNRISNCVVECGPSGKSHFEIWLGPAPWRELARAITGWVEVEDVTVKSVPVRRFFAHTDLRDRTLRLDYVELDLAELGFRGEAGADLASLDYEVRGTVTGDPRAALPWIPKNPAEVVMDLDRARMLSVTGRVAGCFTNLQAFSIDVAGHGEQFVFRGVEITRFDSLMRYSNDVFELRDMRVRRPEGEAQGWVSMDFMRRYVDFDVESTMHPLATARIIGSNAYEFLAPFRFEGPTAVRSRGRVDYEQYEDTDLHAEVQAARAGWDRFMADELRMQVSAHGRQVTFSNIYGSAYGGACEGLVVIENIGHPSSPPRYRVNASIRDADFNRLLVEVRGLTNEPYFGTLSATVTVAGAIGKGMGKTAEGAGWLQVRDGRLFQLPLLGGLSHFLSKVYPGFGFAAQTDLSTQFTIADGSVCTEDAEFQGAMLSIFGAGCCRFDGRLDFAVQVKLLRRSYPAYVVRFLTLPVTKLLEFHLGGTVDQPKWRPQNLPKELFLIFD